MPPVCERWRIPPILGELLVGVALGPGAVDLLHLQIFAGGQATGALALLVPAASGHQLLVDMASISVCVVIFFTAAYLAAKRWLDHLSGWNRRPSTPSLPPASSGVRRST